MPPQEFDTRAGTECTSNCYLIDTVIENGIKVRSGSLVRITGYKLDLQINT